MDLIMEEITRTKTAKEALTVIKKLAHQNFKREICGFLGFDADKREYLVQLEQNSSVGVEVTAASLYKKGGYSAAFVFGVI